MDYDLDMAEDILSPKIKKEVQHLTVEVKT
jgi:hypothetical protein